MRTDKPKLTVKVECVSCKARREIDPASIEPNDVPYCEKCFSPMVVISATARLSR